MQRGGPSAPAIGHDRVPDAADVPEPQSQPQQPPPTAALQAFVASLSPLTVRQLLQADAAGLRQAMRLRLLEDDSSGRDDSDSADALAAAGDSDQAAGDKERQRRELLLELHPDLERLQQRVRVLFGCGPVPDSLAVVQSSLLLRSAPADPFAASSDSEDDDDLLEEASDAEELLSGSDPEPQQRSVFRPNLAALVRHTPPHSPALAAAARPKQQANAAPKLESRPILRVRRADPSTPQKQLGVGLRGLPGGSPMVLRPRRASSAAAQPESLAVEVGCKRKRSPAPAPSSPTASASVLPLPDLRLVRSLDRAMLAASPGRLSSSSASDSDEERAAGVPSPRASSRKQDSASAATSPDSDFPVTPSKPSRARRGGLRSQSLASPAPGLSDDDSCASGDEVATSAGQLKSARLAGPALLRRPQFTTPSPHTKGSSYPTRARAAGLAGLALGAPSAASSAQAHLGSAAVASASAAPIWASAGQRRPLRRQLSLDP